MSEFKPKYEIVNFQSRLNKDLRDRIEPEHFEALMEREAAHALANIIMSYTTHEKRNQDDFHEVHLWQVILHNPNKDSESQGIMERFQAKGYREGYTDAVNAILQHLNLVGHLTPKIDVQTTKLVIHQLLVRFLKSGK